MDRFKLTLKLYVEYCH